MTFLTGTTGQDIIVKYGYQVTSYYIYSMSGYSETVYHHILDQRSWEERQKQHEAVQALVATNLKAFNIEPTAKKKINYVPTQKKRVQLGKGWYCNITDSKHESKHTFLTLHGAPGDHIEWAGLETEMGKSCRWINLTIPGFDGEDERRGDYDGSAQHFSQLIIKLLAVLQIKKIILCAHSLGSIFSTYFITHHPTYVYGYINITGNIDQWYTGLLTFFQTCVTGHGYNCNQWRAKKLMDDDHHRILMHYQFLKLAEGRSFGPVEFPKLTITEYYGYVRLLNTLPNGLSENYYLNQKLRILRVLIFGQKDPIHEPHKTQATIYNLCWGKESYLRLPEYQRLFRTIKAPLEKRLREEFGIEVEGQKIQEYLCYHLEDTGHNAHKRRPTQMSKILKIYMACLEIVEQYSPIVQSKL